MHIHISKSKSNNTFEIKRRNFSKPENVGAGVKEAKKNVKKPGFDK